jgi:hypothetical protein
LLRGGPADIGLYIVQTGGRSWPFIARFAREGECAAPNFAFLAPFTGFIAAAACHAHNILIVTITFTNILFVIYDIGTHNIFYEYSTTELLHNLNFKRSNF